MSDKIYCGSGKEKVFDGGGSLINVSVCVSDIPKEKIFSYKGKSYVKLIVAKKREVDQYGKTHYVAIDEFEPKKSNTDNTIENAVKNADIPF